MKILMKMNRQIVRYWADLAKVRGVSRGEIVLCAENVLSYGNYEGHIYFTESPDFTTSSVITIA